MTVRRLRPVVRCHDGAQATRRAVSGELPYYHTGYYAAFLLDPDGNNVEGSVMVRQPRRL